MSKVEFIKGDIAYTGSGNEVEFIAKLDGEYVVRQIHERDDGEAWLGKPFAITELFKTAPVEKYDKRIAELLETISTLEKRRSDLESELRASKVSDLELKSRLMKHEALTRIDDFLAGKMTHFAMHHWAGWRIMTTQKALEYKESDYDRVPTGMKLVTLFGKTNGDLEWRLHAYSDGSGNSFDQAKFFFSEEEARAFVKDQLEAAYNLWRKDKRQWWGKASSAAEDAYKLGFEVPEDVRAVMEANAVKSLTDARNKAKADYELAEEKLSIGYVPREGKK